MQRTTSLSIAAAAVIGWSMVPAASAQLFSDDLSDGVGWDVNATSGDTAATFGYDYSVDGVPEAPNSSGGTATTGLKMEANIANPAGAESLIAYPVGQSFTGNYRLRFDVWTNFDLDNFYNNGAAGTTEFSGGGLGYNGTDSDIGTGAQLIFTNDGGSGSDWRAFADGAFLGNDEMTGGSRNGFIPYHADFLPSQDAPVAQGQNNSLGGSVAGSPGFQWITVDIIAGDTAISMDIEKPGGDRLQIVRYDYLDRPVTTDGNIGLIHADFFSSVSSAPANQFTIFDNVLVTTDVPEPASLSLLALGGLGLVRRRR